MNVSDCLGLNFLKYMYVLDLNLKIGFSLLTLPQRKYCVACAMYLPHNIHTWVYKRKKKLSKKLLVKCVCV